VQFEFVYLARQIRYDAFGLETRMRMGKAGDKIRRDYSDLAIDV